MKTETLHKPSTCPSCGYLDFDPAQQCSCGYQADESFLNKSSIREVEGKGTEEIKGKVLKNLVKSKKEMTAGDTVIKEIDSWNFSYSQGNDCLCLSTPALQSFSLKLTLDDLEELLEFMYQKTGNEKTMRKLRLSAEELPDLINKVHKMIEEKRSKVSLKFTSSELEEVVDLINTKLKE